MSWEDILKDSRAFINLSGEINISELMKTMTEINQLTARDGDIRQLFADIDKDKDKVLNPLPELKRLTREFDKLSIIMSDTLKQIINYQEMES